MLLLTTGNGIVEPESIAKSSSTPSVKATGPDSEVTVTTLNYGRTLNL